MFRRKWSILPADPTYGDTLEELGYFVHDIDEIRFIQDPKCYFKFFINKNTRWNDRQRFHMNYAIENIIADRLGNLGVHKLTLPLGTPLDKPHVQIFVSDNLPTAKNVIFMTSDSFNDLGVLAHRVIGGVGGINKGSMVSIVQYIQKTQPEAAVVLANISQLWWWEDGKRGVTMTQREGLPLKSAVHWGYSDPYHPGEHVIPGHEDDANHIKTVLKDVLGNSTLANPEAHIHAIGLGSGANALEAALALTWDDWEDRAKSLVLIGGSMLHYQLESDKFVVWMRDRAIACVLSNEPMGTLISTADGNPNTTHITGFGCPVFASGEVGITELMFIKNHRYVLDWIKKVIATDAEGGNGYKNPAYQCNYVDESMAQEEELRRATDDAWALSIEEAEAARVSALSLQEGEATGVSGV